jgi:hypothetical protein
MLERFPISPLQYDAGEALFRDRGNDFDRDGSVGRDYAVRVCKAPA